MFTWAPPCHTHVHMHTHAHTHTCMDALVYAKLWELIKAPNISAETTGIINLITLILLSTLRSKDWRKVKKDMKGNYLCSSDILRVLYFMCRTMFAPGNKKNEPKIHVLMGQQWRLGGSQENGQWWLSEMDLSWDKCRGLQGVEEGHWHL